MGFLVLLPNQTLVCRDISPRLHMLSFVRFCVWGGPSDLSHFLGERIQTPWVAFLLCSTEL